MNFLTPKKFGVDENAERRSLESEAGARSKPDRVRVRAEFDGIGDRGREKCTPPNSQQKDLVRDTEFVTAITRQYDASRVVLRIWAKLRWCLKCAQLIKIYSTPREGEQRYSPGDVVEAVPVPVMGLPKRERICTGHIERQNLSIRMGMRRMTG